MMKRLVGTLHLQMATRANPESPAPTIIVSTCSTILDDSNCRRGFCDMSLFGKEYMSG